MRELTSFQRKCESEVLSLLKKNNLALDNRRVDGQKEAYIYGQVKGLEIWIYEDGAEISSATTDKRFEHHDFKSEDELIAAFASELELVIR
ncbi:MAG: hypothetical protein L0387_19735 [Acidobacteria bacterium]|nr:hypothetical protein [Acidobacteriota bacterium]